MPLAQAAPGQGAKGQSLPLGWLDWQPLLQALLDDLAAPEWPHRPGAGGRPASGDPNGSDPQSIQTGIQTGIRPVIQHCAARFHLALAAAAAQLAAAAAEGLPPGGPQRRLLPEPPAARSHDFVPSAPGPEPLLG
jgi:hypothetical protein